MEIRFLFNKFPKRVWFEERNQIDYKEDKTQWKNDEEPTDYSVPSVFTFVPFDPRCKFGISEIFYNRQRSYFASIEHYVPSYIIDIPIVLAMRQ